MIKIALIGSTGQTGREFLKLALDKGYSVKAMARDPAKLALQHSNLQVVRGDVLSPQQVTQALEGCEVVVSLFGHVKDSPEGLQTRGTKNIVAAMHTHGIEKIISLSGGGLPYPEKDQPGLIDKLIRTIMKITVPKVLDDAIEHHKVLANSDLKWIIVRGPRLTNGDRKGAYRVGWVGVNASTQISRADLADFILKQVADDQFVYQMPFVSY